MVQDKSARDSGKGHRDQGGAARAQHSTSLQGIQGKRKEKSPQLIWQKGAKFSFIPRLGLRCPRRSGRKSILHLHPQEQGQGAEGTVV